MQSNSTEKIPSLEVGKAKKTGLSTGATIAVCLVVIVVVAFAIAAGVYIVSLILLCILHLKKSEIFNMIQQ